MDAGRVAGVGADLAVFQWGRGATPIPALHPGVGDSRIWGTCAPMWADAGHRVVAYDPRGFGDSRWEAVEHDDLADLRAVTAATGTQPAVIVGNSRGGGLALDLALARPSEVLGLVLVAPAPSGFPYETWKSTPAEDAQDALIASALESGKPRRGAPPRGPVLARRDRAARGMRRRCGSERSEHLHWS